MQQKPYSEMTEEEAKAWFGYAFRRANPQDVPEAYVCTCNPELYGSGYGVVAKEYDPYGIYDLDELKQYLIDYPEMDCIGWHKPLTENQQKLKAIRTGMTHLENSKIKEGLYETQLAKFKNDDLWESDDIDDEGNIQRYLITWNGNNFTCDQASALASQYDGDDDEAAAELRTLRTAAKTYIRDTVNTYYEAHHGKPEEPVFPIIYIND